MSTQDKKLDKIQSDIGEIKTHLAVYNEQLKVHIKRSDLLEAKLEPVEKHVERVTGVVKFIFISAAIAAIIEAINLVIK